MRFVKAARPAENGGASKSGSCDRARPGLACAAMKRTRVVLGVAFVASVFSLAGCGQGTYRIPAVEPVVKPKPGSDDLLEDISGGDDSKPASTESKPSGATPPPPEKAPEAKPEAKPDATKSDATKPAEAPKAEPKGDKAESKPDKAAAKAGAKPADAKPAKPNGKK